MMLYKKKQNSARTNDITFTLVNVIIIYIVILQFFIGTAIYSMLRFFLYIIVALCLLSLGVSKFEIYPPRLISVYSISSIFALIFLCLVSIYSSELNWNILVEFILPLLMLYIGYNTKFTKTQKNKLLTKYLALTTFLGFFVIFFYGNGYQITLTYIFAGKNQVGPFIASAVLIAIVLLSKSNYFEFSLRLKTYLALSIITNTTNLIILRNRASLVALFFCLIIFGISKIRIKGVHNKKILLFPFLFFLIPAVLSTSLFTSIFNSIYKSFTLSFDITDVNSLSANRTDVYGQVLRFLSHSLLFGELSIYSDIIDIPHNFLLNLWLNFGILGMLPISLFYIYLWVYTLHKLVVYKENDIGLFLVLLMLVISIFEYTFPFSPLTTVSLAWILLGNFLRDKKNKESSIVNN